MPRTCFGFLATIRESFRDVLVVAKEASGGERKTVSQCTTCTHPHRDEIDRRCSMAPHCETVRNSALAIGLSQPSGEQSFGAFLGIASGIPSQVAS